MSITGEQAAKLLEGTTPGPWESSASKGPLPYGVKPRIYSADGTLLAEVGNLTLDQGAWEAAARLIAAAPDLAAALIASEAARKLAEERLSKAVEALAFYADKDAWNQPAVEVLAGEFGPAYRNKASEMQKDRGNRARAILKEIDNG